MLKLSNKGRYAIQALIDIAFHDAGEPAHVRDIAARQRIPLRFLEQIFQDLKRAGLVGSKRGPRGGYQLAREPSEICVGDVLRATSGPVAGFGSSKPRETKRATKKTVRKGHELREVTDAVLTDLARSIEQCFDAVTIEDVCTRGEELGVRRSPRPQAASYAI